jgi:hypothetical protein
LLLQLLLKCTSIEKFGCTLIKYVIIFEEIRQVCERGACKRLQYAPEFQRIKSEADHQTYLNTMYCLRNSLRSLTLGDRYKATRSSDIAHSLVQNLSEFSDLHSIDINQMNYVEIFYRLGEYIQGCRNLEKLELFWYSGMDTNEEMVPDIHTLSVCPTVKHLRFTVYL